MKTRIASRLLILALAVSSVLATHASACDDQSIRGTYAFTIHGKILLPDGSSLLVEGVAKTTFDGRGNIKQFDAVGVNGNVLPGWRLSKGVYKVNADCTGSFVVTNDPQPPIHAQMLIARSGNSIHAVVIDPGFATTSDAERIRNPKD